jgi:hypothetical protein
MLAHSPHFELSQLILPMIFLLLDLLVVVYCLEDLLKPERRVSGGNKAVWAIIILFSGIGWVFYLLYGRVSA